MKSKILNDLACKHVGDGKRPNLFFVSKQGNIQLITISFASAYKEWHQLAHSYPKIECSLEDRLWGTICDVSPVSEKDKTLTLNDDSVRFLRKH